MKRTLILLISLLFPIEILFGCIGISSFTRSSKEVEPLPEIEKMVSATLQAHGFQLTSTAVFAIQETAFANSAAVEVTQKEGQKTTTPDSTENGLPAEQYIWDIRGHHQYFPIGCEAAAAKDWAAFFNVDLNEFNFQFQLPQSDNPDFGFVGNVDDPWGQVPPFSYGVHAVPVANVLRSVYSMKARSVKGFTLQQLKEQIAANKPVMVWVIGNMVGGVPYIYQDKKGLSVSVAAYEHVVIATGYNQETIRYMNNGKFYDIPSQYFENSWRVLGNMAIYLEE
jgi:uncharacterized protein YvpB